jgi:glycosyltransferase involved in cell wall biosynthesis
MAPSSQERILVAQMGARRHYAIPRIFHQAGMLGILHTDICAVKGWPWWLDRLIPSRLRTSGMRRLFGRVPHGIPTALIRTESDIGWSYAMDRRRCKTRTEVTACHLRAVQAWGKRIARRGMSEFTSVYAFNTDGKEVLQAAREQGLVGYLDQTIPSRETIVRMFQSERDRFPDLVGADTLDQHWQDLAEREKSEWKNATRIFCGSPYVKETIGEVGGPMEKAVVIPTGVSNTSARSKVTRPASEGKTRVLFVGEVGVRKGAHYLIEAARSLGNEFEIRFCGGVMLPKTFLDKAPANVQVVGPVPRSEIARQYLWADVFCLPSLLEGSAAVTYEAMAEGLPIVTTPNSGSLVRDGKDGFLIPARDSSALAAALRRVRSGDLPENREIPTDRPGGPPSFSLEAYQERLVNQINGVES